MGPHTCSAVVEALSPAGVELRTSFGELMQVQWSELTEARSISDGRSARVQESLRPVWDGLTEHTKRAALDRLEIVQEIVTGYRDGHLERARPGEPRSPFGEGFGLSETARCEAMAQTLTQEAAGDRALQRRIAEGELTRVAGWGTARTCGGSTAQT